MPLTQGALSEPPLAACVGLLRKVEALLPSVEASRCERPQVARYVRGENYDEHLDGAVEQHVEGVGLVALLEEHLVLVARDVPAQLAERASGLSERASPR